MRRRHSGTAPGPVATLPPQGPSRSVPLSMPIDMSDRNGLESAGTTS